jgi:hypothetical protein
MSQPGFFRRLAANRALHYFLALAAVLLLLEVVVRRHQAVFESLTDRLKLKGAMFNHRRPTEILFLGSSRFADGISVKQALMAFNRAHGTHWRGFNAAITSANLARMEYLWGATVGKKGLALLVVELSPPTLGAGPLDFDAPEVDSSPKDLESRLHLWFAEHSALVRERKAFKIQMLVNLLAIFAADFVEGPEWARRGFLIDLLGGEPTPVLTPGDPTWQAALRAPRRPDPAAQADEAVAVFGRLASSARGRDVKVCFVVPPLHPAGAAERNPVTIDRFQRIADATGAMVLDFSACPVASRFFVDPNSHLNKEGRVRFSASLGATLHDVLSRNPDVVQ